VVPVADDFVDFVPCAPAAAGERPLDRVRRFLNTRRPELGRDVLARPAEAATWLAEHGYRGVVTPSPETLEGWRDARETVRRLLLGDPAAVPLLDRMLASLGGLRAALATADGGAAAGLRVTGGRGADPLRDVLLAVWRGAADGELRRLKVCADERCRLCFYDRSRNLSRIWCTGGECGNRNRVARHRARDAA
jgi:predicted RNA-binding Zn ribbon-like protein